MLWKSIAGDTLCRRNRIGRYKILFMDLIDLRILQALQVDSSLSNVELARRIHLSPSPCLARVRNLEESGVIQRYVALVNPKAVGLHLSVFISISLKQQSKQALELFEGRIIEQPEVMECYLMTGDADYLLRVVVPDIQSLERFILDQLSPIPGVDKIRSSFTLKQVRYKTALPMPGLEPNLKKTPVNPGLKQRQSGLAGHKK